MKQIKTVIVRELPFFLSVPALVWQALFYYMPLLFVFILSFKQLVDDATVWSLYNYRQLLVHSSLHIIMRSLTIAFVTAVITLCTGYPIAYYLARKADRIKNLLLYFLVLPFWTNMLIQVYAWFAVLERNGILNNLLMQLGIINEPLSLLYTEGAIYLVMLYYYVPFMVIPIYTALEKMPQEYLEASRDLGATRWQTFVHVTLPFSMSGVLTGFFLVFIPAFGEFVIPQLMGGGKYMYVGSLISYYYLTTQNNQLGAAFMCLSSIVLIVASLLIYKICTYVTWCKGGK
jgi:spermidine/putrescine transport system permease protein